MRTQTRNRSQPLCLPFSFFSTSLYISLGLSQSAFLYISAPSMPMSVYMSISFSFCFSPSEHLCFYEVRLLYVSVFISDLGLIPFFMISCVSCPSLCLFVSFSLFLLFVSLCLFLSSPSLFVFHIFSSLVHFCIDNSYHIFRYPLFL